MKCIVLKKRNIVLTAGILITALMLIIPMFSLAVKTVTATVSNSPLTRVKTEGNKVALSVNVYENTDIDSVLLDLGDTKATFFISEEFELKNGDKVKQIASCGHAFGLLEENLRGKSVREISDKLAERIENLSYLTGRNCTLVRFDNNSFDSAGIKTVFSLGLYPVQWSTDDTTENVVPGDIILITGESEIDEFIKKITADGYETSTVDVLLFESLQVD